MKYIFLFGLLNLAVFSSAQNFTISNQTTFGGDQKDYVSSVIYTSDHSILVSGTTKSGATGDKTEVNRGGFDFLVVKYDLEYNEIWQKTIGGDAYDNSFDAIELSDASYLLAGFSASGISGDKTDPLIGAADYWLIKLDPNGEILWQKVYGAEGSNSINRILELNDGSIIVCGTSNADISGVKTENSKGGTDYWIIKIDTNGNIIWDRTIGSDASEYYPDVLKDENEDLYIVGYTFGNISGDKTENNYDNSQDVWVVKMDTDGNIIWDKTIGSNETEYSALAVYNSGYIYIAMGSDGEIGGLKTEANFNSTNGYTDTWLVKLDLDGNLIWDKTIGGIGPDGPSDIVALDNEHILLSNGSSSNISGNKTEDRIGHGDNWLVNIDVNANIIWDKTIGGLDGDYGARIALINENQFILAGNSTSGVGGNKTDYCRGEEDFWVYTLDVSQNINELTETSQELNIYPNPANNFVQIEWNVSSNQKIEIFNITGQEIYSNQLTDNNLKINVSSFEKGIYVLRVGNITKKLIIE